MKRVVFIGLLFLFITTNTIAQDIKSDALIDIASFVSNKNIKIENWKVTMKETMDKEAIQSTINELKKKHDFTKTENENSIKYSFANAHKSQDVAVFYNVVIPIDGSYRGELIAVIEGDSWNNPIKENYQLKRDLTLQKMFTESVRKFTCLTTQEDAIIGSDYFLKEFTNYLDLHHEETQLDTVRNSAHRKIIYGYTQLWEEKITTNNSPVNFQLAVTTGGTGKPIYTIGTPILINEY